MKKAPFIVAMFLLSQLATFAQQKSPAENLRTSKQYEHTLSQFKESHIYPTSDPDVEVYRIFVAPTFSHALSIRIEGRGTEYILVARYLSGQVGYDWGTLKGEKKRRLKEKEWQKLLNLLKQASFWSLASEDKEPEPNEKGVLTVCLDNTNWYLEGVSRGKYHAVERYCPDSKDFKSVGLYMVKLSRLHVKESELH